MSAKTRIPFQVGITGGIGSGKSVVARIFGLLGVPVYESDVEAKKLYLEPVIREKVIRLMGSEAYSADGRPDTAFIAGQIYNDTVRRKALNDILHPAVGAHYKQWLQHQSHPYILKVAALLFEAGIAAQLDATILIVSRQSLKVSRLADRDSFRPKEQILQIMESQWPDQKKIPLADYLFYNEEEQSLIQQVVTFHEKMMDKLTR
jgi:dephospho-CoA kinase